MNRRQMLESIGIHDQPKCGAPYEMFSGRLGLVTLTCHKPIGHDENHIGGGDGGAASWGPDDTQSYTAIAYRQGLADRS